MKVTEKNNEQLVVSVFPDQNLALEWMETSSRLSSVNTLGLQQEIQDNFANHPETWLYLLGFTSYPLKFSPSLNYFVRFSRSFVQSLLKIPELEALRDKAMVGIPAETMKDFFSMCPMMAGAEYVTHEMLEGLWTGFNQAFSHAIEKFHGPVSEYIRELNPDLHPAGRIFFHLVENKKQESSFAFMATYSVGMGANGKPKHLPLKHALETHDDDALLDLLSTVYKAGEKSSLIAGLIESGELFYPLSWDSRDAFTFLKEIPDYEAAGVICRIPDWWKKNVSAPRINISIGDNKPAMVGLKALMDCKVDIVIGDLSLSREEIKNILEHTEGLAFIKNRWVAVDHEKLKQALQACERIQDISASGMTLGEAMRTGLNPEKMFGKTTENLDVDVSNGQWLDSVFEKMTHPEKVAPAVPGKGFRARLRPYQMQGMNWLNFLNKHGIGACLADDMGLGKTIQILAWLSTLPRNKKKPANLLVVPSSLIANWESEISRFLPGLRTLIAHPGFIRPDTALDKALTITWKNKEMVVPPSTLDKLDLVITSYTLVKRYEWLGSYTWNCLILDEAQAIKNPSTQQTRAIKSLMAHNRVIMTGTPVENKLADLWSLFDFVNPGLLGNKSEFSHFAKTLKDNPKGYARLRKMISPYILRRLKTDKSIIADLPDKVEMKVFADLTSRQVILYKKLIRDLKKALETSEGIQKKGLVLSFLTRFKQLCNHPDQLTGSGDFTSSHSGKFLRLGKICETIYEKREQMLVFTQFKEMTLPLQAFLETIFHHPGLVLHGSVSVAKRKKLIQQFQDDTYCPFMVLSLKAGGVGLNLTRANHVVHFDRWWNPAVENQATDRAFRIGQTKKVLVHKFVTKGTIEEKIDQMIMEKQEMADQIVSPSGETLITEMEDQNILKLFQLSLSA